MRSLVGIQVGLPPNASRDQRKAKARAVLAAAQAREYGTGAGRVRDPAWEHDLGDIFGRISPHPITKIGPAGSIVTEIVSVKPDTLVALIDENNEVCGWIYEEST